MDKAINGILLFVLFVWLGGWLLNSRTEPYSDPHLLQEQPYAQPPRQPGRSFFNELPGIGSGEAIAQPEQYPPVMPNGDYDPSQGQLTPAECQAQAANGWRGYDWIPAECSQPRSNSQPW